MNSTSANWLKFIRLLASRLIARVKAFFDGLPVLILDDTVHKRDRSKKVELLTRVRDHNDGRYYRGFRCLTLCFHIRNFTIPLDFRLLSSHKEKTRINGSRQDLDKRTNGYKLRQYAISKSSVNCSTCFSRFEIYSIAEAGRPSKSFFPILALYHEKPEVASISRLFRSILCAVFSFDKIRNPGPPPLQIHAADPQPIRPTTASIAVC